MRKPELSEEEQWQQWLAEYRANEAQEQAAKAVSAPRVEASDDPEPPRQASAPEPAAQVETTVRVTPGRAAGAEVRVTVTDITPKPITDYGGMSRLEYFTRKLSEAPVPDDEFLSAPERMSEPPPPPGMTRISARNLITDRLMVAGSYADAIDEYRHYLLWNGEYLEERALRALDQHAIIYWRP